MSLKSKGISAERELIHLFWANGYAATRVAGSGSIRYPCPDIIAGNVRRKLAIECKVSKEKKKYIPIEEIHQLQEYSTKFGAESWIAVKFSRENWFFLTLEDLEYTSKSALISFENAKTKGLLFEEVIK